MKTNLNEIETITLSLLTSPPHAPVRTLAELYGLVPNPDKMTWFKKCCPYMDLEDYSRYLKKSWLDEEDPNQDKNVSREEIVAYFRKAAKLMTPEEQAYFDRLPASITIYRGVSPHRATYGLSWTADKEKASWFKGRYEKEGEQGKLLKATIDKKHAICYIDELQEKELVVDVFKIKDSIEQIIP
ncbi:hypothetical protein SELR_pSRC101440 (plasmid) [Selenomonas ruminantium subsp. lactilytica TAM6421]|uniref:EF-hand domain-containing protein n=1 Tax=Selenomonas ruminantium subsp. lactilytica (strain NBRC 103574 / TAM6421) TaxID=927704 RepID=I0GW14_SELRL|nr:hypothetical protein [Selenomonas ruminantium]BAL84951.1 hypothetical protein SELR_pSRC101440 [Selenomonas ruminantium subsp. lactilytica TAM6421]